MLRKAIAENIEELVSSFVTDSRYRANHIKVLNKRALFEKRGAEIVKVTAEGQLTDIQEEEELTISTYKVHYKYLIKQGNHMYQEEEVEHRRATFENGEYVLDQEVESLEEEEFEYIDQQEDEEVGERISFEYDRLKAVQYAEKWWDSYNPAYKKFEVDCTNYISQCLHAGGAPMRGVPNRSKGWWMNNNNWSYSWSVANSMRWFLPSAKVGLRAKVVSKPEDLKLGDVICYDFQGDGRFDHTTIVTAKDANGMPLVNAHTYNSRSRYWNYEDSTAYTPNIQYKFFTIVDDQ